MRNRSSTDRRANSSVPYAVKNTMFPFLSAPAVFASAALLLSQSPQAARGDACCIKGQIGGQQAWVSVDARDAADCGLVNEFKPGVTWTGVDTDGDGTDDVCEDLLSLSDGFPAVSQWGLIVMTLLVLTAGTVILARRRRPAAA